MDHYRAALDAVSDFCLITRACPQQRHGRHSAGLDSASHEVAYANAAALGFLNRTAAEVLDQRLEDIWPSSGNRLLASCPEIVADGREHRFTMRREHPDGRVSSYQVLVTPCGSDLVITGRDITAVLDAVSALVDNEERFRRSRQDSVASLAAGIAHEFNSPIQYVTDNTQFLAETFADVLRAVQDVAQVVDAALVRMPDAPPLPRARHAEPVADGAAVQAVQAVQAGQGGQAAVLPAPGPDVRPASEVRTSLTAVRSRLRELELDFFSEEVPAAIAQTREGLQRISEIVAALLAFTQPSGECLDTDLGELVANTVTISQHEWKDVAEVEVSVAPDPELNTVPCVAADLRQILLNLVTNACRAIRNRPSDPPPEHGKLRISLDREGQRAVIRVRDNGTGMDEATVEKVFDPFFTTDEACTGHGRGLSFAYASIVKQQDGTIEIASTPSVGTTVTISLPLTRNGASRHSAPPDAR